MIASRRRPIVSSPKTSEQPSTLGSAGCSLRARRPGRLKRKSSRSSNQLNRGTVLIDSLEERERVAELILIAAKRAKTSTAYASALTYLAAGRALLAADSWEQQYVVTFALEFQRAEREFLSGAFVAAEQRLSMLRIC